MFQRIFLIILSLVIAIVGGAWSVSYILDTFDGFGRLKIGQWIAYPQAGTADADIYARARAAKRGDISLGRTEGLIFQLWRDNRHHTLKSQCTYRLRGYLPETRLFTLYAADHELHPQWVDDKLPTELSSDNVIWDQDGSLNVLISPQAQARNWLATRGNNEYGLILTLYDTPIATSTALQKLNMPTVEVVQTGVRNCD